MHACIQRHRRRTHKTQQQVADMLLTTKPNICNIEKGRRHVSADIMMAGYERCDDPILLNDMTFEFTAGYSVPTPSETVYDDHRMCIKERLSREVAEAKEALMRFRIDKRPEHCTQEELEGIRIIISEIEDALFEATALVNKISFDYGIKPQEIAKSRNQRLKMQRRA